eukprot:TRINITY_DN6124_c0_g1_i2.p1 TRINITY_DN6124_c0_g1~~TRINITY_DN6124_c0_g1_i2.p1  ORF type:complete len:117 (+),score=30.95 TRINITY_DN6124_c0_g1_i2:69-419(+)
MSLIERIAHNTTRRDTTRHTRCPDLSLTDMSDTKKKLADIEVQDRREPTPVDASGGAFVESDMVGLLRHRRAEMEEEEEMMEMLADLTNDVLHLRVGKMAERAQREAEAQEAATNG